VRAALDSARLGLIDNWLRHVQDVHAKYHVEVDNAGDLDARVNRLCELNVIEQAVHVCKTTVVQDAWGRHQPVAVHAWIYGLDDGRLRDLSFGVASARELRSGVVTALNSRPQLKSV
jgi:carbonic anhydrase